MSSFSFTEELRQAQQEARKRIEKENKDRANQLSKENESLALDYKYKQQQWVITVLPIVKAAMMNAAKQGEGSVTLEAYDDFPYPPRLMRKKNLKDKPETIESYRIIDCFRLVQEELGEGIKVDYKCHTYEYYDEPRETEYMKISWDNK